VYLNNNITLYIQKGAILLGSNQIEHYPEQDKTGTRMDWYLSRSLIFARNKNNISVKGDGLLNGNSKSENNFMTEERKRKYRPMILWFDNCDNVLVEGVTFTGSGYWTQAYTRCRNGRINGVTVTDSFFENNDGCDIVDCENFIVENCNIDRVVDDGICLKAYTKTGCKNIIIRNNKVRTLCNALKTGTDSSGDGFQNILIENNELTQIGRAGIALEITDGGTMKNVIVRNIKMDIVGCPIFIKLGNRQRPMIDPNGKEFFPDKVGIIQDVHISGIQAIVDDVIKPPKEKYYPDEIRLHKNHPMASSVSGIPGHYIERVFIDDVDIEIRGGFDIRTAEDANREVPENSKNYPNPDMMGTLSAYGFFIRHVKDIQMNNIRVVMCQEDGRPAIVLDDVQDSTFRDMETENISQTVLFRIKPNCEGIDAGEDN
jgi:hypothetical protein